MDWLGRFLWKPFHLLWSVVLAFFSFFVFYSTRTFSARSGLRLMSNFNSQVSDFSAEIGYYSYAMSTLFLYFRPSLIQLKPPSEALIFLKASWNFLEPCEDDKWKLLEFSDARACRFSFLHSCIRCLSLSFNSSSAWNAYLICLNNLSWSTNRATHL